VSTTATPNAAVAGTSAADKAAEVREVLSALDRELVALTPVKRRIREIAALLVIDRLRLAEGISTMRPSLHMSFTGHPGTGKTTVALKMAEILYRLGYIEKNRLVTVTRDDLVGQYVGHTAPKTKEVVKAATGGVLFIDEAYYLHRPENERDYGAEAVEVLLHVMETEQDRLVVILAGYREPMENFFRANPGMGSRVAHHIDFPDYSVPELMAIGELMVDQRGYVLTDEASEALQRYIEVRSTQPRFANARSIRNAIDRARLRQAARLFEATGTPTREQLITIEAQDILQSSVFAENPDLETDPDLADPDRAHDTSDN
jgi:probable Rubsico expression protein CbbX